MAIQKLKKKDELKVDKDADLSTQNRPKNKVETDMTTVTKVRTFINSL